MSANRVYYNCNLICVLLLLMTVDWWSLLLCTILCACNLFS
jgi:hypothetical protein